MMTFQPVTYNGSRLDASIELGQKIADQWGTHSLMIQMARDITRQWRTRNRLDEARAIYAWVNRRVRYVPDPLAAEMIADPLTTIKNGGDCDDLAVLAAALLQAIGHDARIGAVTWKGRTDPSHAVAVDLTAGAIVDPVGNTPEAWPPAPYEVQAIKYRDKAGQLQTLNGWFSKAIKSVAKGFQSILPAKTLLGKIADPLGLTDPKRNLNLVGRIADVVGTGAAIAAGGWALGAATGATGGFWSVAGAGASAAGSGLGTAAGWLGSGLKALSPLLATGLLKGGGAAPQQVAGQGAMTPEQAAAWAAYGSGAPGSAGYGGGGGGGAMTLPDGTVMPGSAPAPSTSLVIPLAIAAGVGLLLLTRNRSTKRKET